jgi:hypothetical protein
MDKFLELNDKLSQCYHRFHFSDYLRLSNDEKEQVCSKEKTDLRNYLNSDSMSHENILKEKLSYYEG